MRRTIEIDEEIMVAEGLLSSQLQEHEIAWEHISQSDADEGDDGDVAETSEQGRLRNLKRNVRRFGLI